MAQEFEITAPLSVRARIGSSIVHGRLEYALSGQCVCDWPGRDGRVRKLSCPYPDRDRPHPTLTRRGTGTPNREVGGQKALQLSTWTENDPGWRATPGEATPVLDA